MDAFQDKGKCCHDDDDGDEDLPGCSEIASVGITILSVGPYQGNGKTSDEN
ncbi:hypothetical protein BH09BAC5_BH09BAC5_10950 [soil metagenome]